jgi:hypothetical protein
MMSSPAMARAVLVAVVLMQCCNVMIVAARPFLMEAPVVATTEDGGWLGMIMQVLKGGPGGNNHNCQAPNGSCP